MAETSFTTAYGHEQAGARAISTTQLLGQVLFLVAIALGFCALGTYLGRDLEVGTARIISFAGFGMLLLASFGGAPEVQLPREGEEDPDLPQLDRLPHR